MGSQGPGRKRIPNRNGLTAEEDALNLIAKEAEARLAAKRAARAEAREIRMKELERQQKEFDDTDRDFLEKGSSQASTLSTATLTSLGSCRGSGDSTVTADAETSMQEIKEIHELKDQIQDVEAKYMQSLKEVKDSLVEMDEKYRKAMVSNAQLDNEKTNLMYQVDTLKDSLMELEEFLAETRRESEEKSKHLEREKHAYSILQFQFNDLKETLKQSEELLTKHGIVLGPDLSTSQEAGADVTDTSASAEVPQGSKLLGPQEFQLGRDGNVGSCREDRDQQSKDLDYEMQSIHLHPRVPGKLLVAQNDDGGLVNHDFKSQTENNSVSDTNSAISKSEFRDSVKTKDNVILQDSKCTLRELDSVPLTTDLLTTDQQESSVSITINEMIQLESPKSTNNALEICLISTDDMKNAQDKKASEESAEIDKNAPHSQSASSSSKKKKKKKKSKQKQKPSEKRDSEARDNNDKQLKEGSTAQRRETDPEFASEFGDTSAEVSMNKKVTPNLNKEENMDPENKDELHSPESKIDILSSSGNTESKVMSNINYTFSLETKSDCVAFQNISSNTENPLLVGNERDLSLVVNNLVENKTHSQVVQLDETCFHEYQYDEVERNLNFAVDHKGEKAHLEDRCGDSKLNTTEEISIDMGVGGTPSEHKQHKDITEVQLPGAEQECQGDAYTVQNIEDQVKVECEESSEFHEGEVPSADIGLEQVTCKPQELIAAHSKEVDQLSQMNKQSSESHDGEQLTLVRERCYRDISDITEDQEIVTEEQNQAQGITENEDERSQDHQEMKDAESSEVNLGQEVISSVQPEGENVCEQ